MVERRGCQHDAESSVLLGTSATDRIIAGGHECFSLGRIGSLIERASLSRLRQLSELRLAESR